MIRAWLAKDYSDPRKGSEDAVLFLKRSELPGRGMDMALHPFLKRSMRYDAPLTYDPLNIWLDTGRDRRIVPVALKTIAACFVFLVEVVVDRLERRAVEVGL